ncbi:extracellular solute-binding protein [Nakamurella flava]|uniref:Extracellular solute-binding protein n=1 Tax=Nakamurella flava TaxID=2576308 RepID=A0A4U6QM84_9ACTN|nr:extracellular solute-binding protein [Nakamurella flava]TKV61226.1 extracellular solute-binding protein [Nakamurella flava]
MALSLAACGKGGSSNTAATTDANGTTTLKMWTHNAGNDKELAAITQVVNDYNGSQSKYKVEIQAFPQDSYNTSVTAAAASKSLPCILDVDGPNVPNWAWAGYLAPLDGMDDQISKFLPSVVGKYNDKNYAVGYYDVALVMEARKSALEASGIRIPTIDSSWTKDEFAAALAAIKATGKWENTLDMQTGNTGEWWPYAYSPFLQSFGGDLINRDDYKSADGVLNGAAAVEWANWFRSLTSDGYMPLKSGADPGQDFLNGKTAILYNGSWGAEAAKASSIADDILFLPSVDLGNGPKIGGGSWQWAVGSGCSAPEGALDYMKFAMQDKYVASVSEASGTIPATDGGAALVKGYETGGEYDIFRQYSKKFAEVRPVTPGYPFIATTFTKTAQDILNGADPQATLDQAVKDIDANQQSNNNFQ